MSTLMLRVDRLTKCRTTSTSLSSGNGGGSVARNRLGNSSSMAGVGTSQAGTRWHRRPGRLSSKSKAVDCGLSIMKFPGERARRDLPSFDRPCPHRMVGLSWPVRSCRDIRCPARRAVDCRWSNAPALSHLGVGAPVRIIDRKHSTELIRHYCFRSTPSDLA